MAQPPLQDHKEAGKRGQPRHEKPLPPGPPLQPFEEWGDELGPQSELQAQQSLPEGLRVVAEREVEGLPTCQLVRKEQIERRTEALQPVQMHEPRLLQRATLHILQVLLGPAPAHTATDAHEPARLPHLAALDVRRARDVPPLRRLVALQRL